MHPNSNYYWQPVSEPAVPSPVAGSQDTGILRNRVVIGCTPKAEMQLPFGIRSKELVIGRIDLENQAGFCVFSFLQPLLVNYVRAHIQYR